MTRPDLLALTDDALAELTNRGLLKRAAREVAASPPAVSIAADGTVTAVFADDVTTTLVPGRGVDGGTCSCGATAVCRHRVATVLALRVTAEPAVDTTPEWVAWSPGAATDDALIAQVGPRAVAEARRRVAGGATALVRRPTRADPVAVVETPTATVRFLVAGDLSAVDCDATAVERDVLLVLAVLAFREADARDPDGPVVAVEHTVRAAVDAGAVLVLDRAAATVDEVLRHGVAEAGPTLVTALRRDRDGCTRHGLRWPAAVLDDLADQLVEYAGRGAGHSMAAVADLVTELHARRRAAAVAPAAVLGLDEPAETPLRRVRLIALGCRVGRVESETDTEPGADTAEILYAHPDAAMVLASRHRWSRSADGTGTAVRARRVAGATVAALSAGTVLSEAAVRSAGRLIRFGTARTSRTSVMPVGAGWSTLPPALLLADYAAASDLVDGLSSPLVRPRVVADVVRVLPIGRVLDIGYHPGAQRLDAVIADAAGATATVSLVHRAVAPGALDALAVALRTNPVQISGRLSRGRDGLVVEPYAVRCADGVVVLDLADVVAGAEEPVGDRRVGADPVAAALDDALEALAEAAHRGLERPRPSTVQRIATAADVLAAHGLSRCATLLREHGAQPRSTTDWVRARVRLLTARDVLG